MIIASFNVENLFARAKVLDSAEPNEEVVRHLKAFERFNRTAHRRRYRPVDKRTMIDDLLTLGVLVRSGSKVIRQDSIAAQLAILRENRGDFFVEHQDARGVEIVAGGRGDWVGWLELVVEPVDETAIRMTARVVLDVHADILAVVEAENRPSLVRFNEEMLGNRYRHVMLVDGNDQRGIDVGLLTTRRYPITSVTSHVDDRDTRNTNAERRDKRLFSRDAPVYTVHCGEHDVFVVVNHLKSQSRTGTEPPDDLRTRQSDRLAAIYRELRRNGATYVAMVGDFNRGPDDGGHPSLEALFNRRLGLVDAYSLHTFKVGPRPGSFQGSSLRDRLDYIFLSPELAVCVKRGGVFRKGLWGRSTNVNPPDPKKDGWTMYPEITESKHAASDHAAIWVDVRLP